MTPKEVVKKWVEAFNKKNVEALGELYIDTAINHQVNTEPLQGKD
jgi:hypothetical protein